MDQAISFGAWLRHRRYMLGLTQNDLARLAGYSVSLIQKVEAGARRPSRQMVARFTEHLTLPDDQPTALLEIAADERAHRTLHNLPAPLTSFVGREAELAALAGLRDRTRLLTLVGPGGVGKTRLALCLSANLLSAFPDGIWLVELAPLTDAALVPQAVIAALGLREELRDLLLLVTRLRNKRLLLILDNCEHLIEACAQLAETLLHANADLHILATSREPLGITGETVFLVPPLAEQPAVVLFTQRAQAAHQDFALTGGNVIAIAEICRRLDGLPLAIELAATQVRLLATAQILTYLETNLGLLAGSSRTAAPRHQSLQALIDWSYALLTPQERALLQRLAVFSGGFALGAAESVAGTVLPGGDDGLTHTTHDTGRMTYALVSSLLDKCMIQRVGGPSSEPRFTMLETILQYARERLVANGIEEETRRWHACFFVQMVEAVQPPDLRPPAMADLDRLDLELGNIRAAFGWMLRPEGSDEERMLALRLAAALEWYWRARGSSSEGLRWSHASLQTAGLGAPPALRMMAVKAAIWVALELRDPAAARMYLAEYQALAQELKQAPLIANSILATSTVATFEGRHTDAERLMHQALAFSRAEGDELGSAYALTQLARHVEVHGDTQLAITLFEEAAALAQKLGYMSGLGIALTDLGRLALDAGEYAQAARHFQAGLALKWNHGWRATVPYSLDGIARALAAQNDAVRALRLLSATTTFRAALNPLGLPGDDALLRDLHVRLSETAFAEAWAAGQELSLEQAVVEALACDDKDARL
jgi:predicted ATPase